MPQKIECVDMELPDYADVLEETERVIRQCFKQFRLEEVFLSFNGGKDCTVLLDLVINILKDMHKNNDVTKDLKVMYIRTSGPFREIEEFVHKVESHYKIKLKVIEGEIQSSLSKVLEDDCNIKACLMGTRRSDPHSENLQFIQKTDPGWPQVMRVSPILNWSYHQIWNYILQRQVPYCSLYDQGYTSIGSIENTRPNSSLAYKTPSGEVKYHPAWLLTNASLEREGRGSKPPVNGHTNGTNHI